MFSCGKCDWRGGRGRYVVVCGDWRFQFWFRHGNRKVGLVRKGRGVWKGGEWLVVVELRIRWLKLGSGSCFSVRAFRDVVGDAKRVGGEWHVEAVVRARRRGRFPGWQMLSLRRKGGRRTGRGRSVRHRVRGSGWEVGPVDWGVDWSPTSGCAPGAVGVAGLRGGEVEG